MKPRRIVLADPVKTTTMSTKVLVFNVAAGLMVVAGVSTGVRTHLFPPQTEVCSKFYRHITGFTLEQGGALLSAAQVQGAADGQDYGITENLTVERASVNQPATMVIKFAQNSAKPMTDLPPTGGISFPWSPRPLQNKSAACLAYNVFLPENFEFSAGGTLPGFASAARGVAAVNDAGFTIQPVWSTSGLARLSIYLKTDTDALPAHSHKFEVKLPRGRWFKIEQEAVLNTPGESDGINRLWVDGHLVAEQLGVVMRRSDEVTIGQVNIDAYFGGHGFATTSPLDQKMLLGPIEIKWNDPNAGLASR